MPELNEYKSHLEQFQHWQSSVTDVQTALELLELESDDALVKKPNNTSSSVFGFEYKSIFLIYAFLFKLK